MNSLKYKGYIAILQYDEDDEEFFGEVINTSRDQICFGGRNVRELKKHMKEAVDGHIENCRKLGLEPEKPYSGRVTFRTTPEQHALIMQAAIKAGERSLNSWIDHVLSREIKRMHVA